MGPINNTNCTMRLKNSKNKKKTTKLNKFLPRFLKKKKKKKKNSSQTDGTSHHLSG